MTTRKAVSDGGRHERRWPASATVVCVMALQQALPPGLLAGPRWLLPALELSLLVPILAANPVRLSRDSAWLRRLGLALTSLLFATNTAHLALLVTSLISGGQPDSKLLLQAALLIWVTNVAVTALAMWEVDRGGPFARDPRHARREDPPDLLFPQMSGVPGWDAGSWRPGFTDYLFVAFTAATAFSPTDTMPLSPRAKILTAAAASVSLLTLALIAARAVNVL